MPELPEVETVRRRLQEVLPGKQLTDVRELHPKPVIGDISRVKNTEVVAVDRRAKLLQINLSNQLHLLVHLKMTGQLIYVDPDSGTRLGGGHPTADWVRGLPSNHTRTVFSFADDSKLFFNDQRLFGWIKVLEPDQLAAEYEGLGPDVNSPEVTSDYLYPLLQRRSIAIKQAIMDNAIMCGVGNIYACDALNLAKIDPTRPSKSLSKSEVDHLLAVIKDVIDRGIEMGGTTTDGKYVDIHGFAGGYQEIMRTYDREGEPCLNCGTPIAKMKIGGRGTYYCPNCQK